MAELVAQSPEQTVPDPPNRFILQSRVTISGKQYLLRLVIEPSGTDNVLVTGYRTSKVGKYWVKP
jgi:hypothetical protein